MGRYVRLILIILAAQSLLACSRQVDVPDHDGKALVAAIRAANASPGGDRILLAHRGLYVLSDAAQAGLLLPAIHGALEIDGNGAEIRSYAPGRVALLEVAADGDVQLRNLSLAEASDGAIRNFGKLRMQSARIVDSTGTWVSAIVLNHGQLSVEDSEIAYNELQMSGRDAGTVLNYGELQLDQSRIHDNRVQRVFPSLIAAGAVLNLGVMRTRKTQLENNIAGDLQDLASRRANLVAGVFNLGNGRVDAQ